MSYRFIFSFFVVLLCFTEQGLAQKFGYVDTEFILSKMSEYQEAQKEIKSLSVQWQQEIKDKQLAIEGKYAELKAEEVLLTEEMVQERKDSIRAMEEELKKFQQQIFGYEGLYFLKKKELMKPSMDLVFDAVEKVSQEFRLDFVFDKSGGLVMIYTNPVHDYTDYVLEELGLGEPEDQLK